MYLKLFAQILFALLVVLLFSENLKVFVKTKLDISTSNIITLLCCCDVERNPGPNGDKLRQLLTILIKIYWEVDSKREFTKTYKSTTEAKRKKGMYDTTPPHWDTTLWFGNPNKVPKAENKSTLQYLLEMVLGLTKCMQKENRNFTKGQRLAIHTALNDEEQSGGDHIKIEQIRKLLTKLTSHSENLVCEVMKGEFKTLWQAITNYGKKDAVISTQENPAQSMTQNTDSNDPDLTDLIKKVQELLTEEKQKFAKRKKNARGKKCTGDASSSHGIISAGAQDNIGSKTDNSHETISAEPSMATDGGKTLKGKGKKRKISDSGFDDDACSDIGLLNTQGEDDRILADVMEIISHDTDCNGDKPNTTTYDSSGSDISLSNGPSNSTEHDPMVSGSKTDSNDIDNVVVPCSTNQPVVSARAYDFDDAVPGPSGLATYRCLQSPSKKQKLTENEYSSDEDDSEIDESLLNFCKKINGEWDEEDDDDDGFDNYCGFSLRKHV